ncbi:hypothetical protein AGMMS50212_16350 [Spirochaetia bacterium]|nr:hypothetical protein AGMMS50212_16350 [Spirochaetia bacterium]
MKGTEIDESIFSSIEAVSSKNDKNIRYHPSEVRSIIDIDDIDDFLKEHLSLDVIKDTALKFLNRLKIYTENLDISNKVSINTAIVKDITLRYLHEVVQFELLHKNMRVSERKCQCIVYYWIFKKKPIQVIKNEDESKLLYINEKYILSCLMSDLSIDNDINFTKRNNEPAIMEYVNSLFLMFQNDGLTKEYFEVLTKSFSIGINLGRNKNDNFGRTK